MVFASKKGFVVEGLKKEKLGVKEGLSQASDNMALASSRQVAWDSNMLLNIARFKIDVFSEAKKMFGNVEFVVPKQVIRELDGLSKESKKLSNEVRIAKELVGKRGVKVVEIDARNADEALLKLASKAIIATNDKELKESVRELNGKVLYLRQRKFLEIC